MEVTAIEVAACAHGIVLVAFQFHGGEKPAFPWVVLQALPRSWRVRRLGGDNACRWGPTLARIETAVIASKRKGEFHMLTEDGSEAQIESCTCVNAWHGEIHTPTCQNRRCVRNCDDAGLDDGEHVERVFTGLSAIAPLYRTASTPRRLDKLEGHFLETNLAKEAKAPIVLLQKLLDNPNLLEQARYARDEAMSAFAEYEDVDVAYQRIVDYVRARSSTMYWDPALYGARGRPPARVVTFFRILNRVEVGVLYFHHQSSRAQRAPHEKDKRRLVDHALRLRAGVAKNLVAIGQRWVDLPKLDGLPPDFKEKLDEQSILENVLRGRMPWRSKEEDFSLLSQCLHAFNAIQRVRRVEEDKILREKELRSYVRTMGEWHARQLERVRMCHRVFDAVHHFLWPVDRALRHHVLGQVDAAMPARTDSTAALSDPALYKVLCALPVTTAHEAHAVWLLAVRGALKLAELQTRGQAALLAYAEASQHVMHKSASAADLVGPHMADAREFLGHCALAENLPGIPPLASEPLDSMPRREFSPDATAVDDLNHVPPAFFGSDADLELAEAVAKGGVRGAAAELWTCCACSTVVLAPLAACTGCTHPRCDECAGVHDEMEPRARGGLEGMDAHMDVDGQAPSPDGDDDELEVLWTIPAPSPALVRHAMEATPATGAVGTPAPTPRPAGSLPMAAPAAVTPNELDNVRARLDGITNDLEVVVPDGRGGGLMRVDFRSLEPGVFVNDAVITSYVSMVLQHAVELQNDEASAFTPLRTAVLDTLVWPKLTQMNAQGHEGEYAFDRLYRPRAKPFGSWDAYCALDAILIPMNLRCGGIGCCSS
mmetsp:Transcript_22602/g.58127  ORF Transcript_22602/g.58127 Transcript_22602/m.58127 type:complete len:828 (+) Transcript_22602:931-3414(+)